MKKYVNGKFYELTKEEHEANKKRFAKFVRKTNTSDSEQRVKELEETVKALSKKIEELQK